MIQTDTDTDTAKIIPIPIPGIGMIPIPIPIPGIGGTLLQAKVLEPELELSASIYYNGAGAAAFGSK